MSLLRPGSLAPDVELVNQFGELVRVGDLRGAPALLVFFPLAFTPVCEGELAELAAHHPTFEARGARVVGISVDHRYALRDAADRLGVGFDLLSDFWPHGAAARAFGCFDEVRGHATRASFVLDAGGAVRDVVTSEHGHPRDVADYLAALERWA